MDRSSDLALAARRVADEDAERIKRYACAICDADLGKGKATKRVSGCGTTQWWQGYIKHARAALALADAEAAAKREAGWQPIETVPSGEPVLLWFPCGEKGAGGMETAMVFPPDLSGGWTHGGPNSGDDFQFCERPTMWRPLSAPPSTRP